MKLFVLIFLVLSSQVFAKADCLNTNFETKLKGEYPQELTEDFCHSLKNIYPELSKANIDLKSFKKTYVNLASRFNFNRVLGKNSGYVIFANNQRMQSAYDKISRDAVYAIITHELAHTYHYSLINLFQGIGLAPIALNEKKNRSFEKFVDLIAIYQSFKAGVDIAPGLTEYRNWQRKNLSEEKEREYVATYYQEEDLFKFTELFYSSIPLEVKLDLIKKRMLPLLDKMNRNSKFLKNL